MLSWTWFSSPISQSLIHLILLCLDPRVTSVLPSPSFKLIINQNSIFFFTYYYYKLHLSHSILHSLNKYYYVVVFRMLYFYWQYHIFHSRLKSMLRYSVCRVRCKKRLITRNGHTFDWDGTLRPVFMWTVLVLSRRVKPPPQIVNTTRVLSLEQRLVCLLILHNLSFRWDKRRGWYCLMKRDEYVNGIRCWLSHFVFEFGKLFSSLTAANSPSFGTYREYNYCN